MWLRDHWLTLEYLQQWGITVSPATISVPVYGVAGHYQYTVTRDLIRGGYAYTPKGCRPSASLYGIHRALRSIHQSGEVILVEGFSDALALHRAGATNTLALMGSSISKMQWSLIRLLAHRIILLLDGDEPGIAAAKKEIERRGKPPFMVAVMVRDLDPAEYLYRTGGDIAPLLQFARHCLGHLALAVVDSRGGISMITEREGANILSLLPTLPFNAI